jgi:hypothetical protein
LERGRRIVSAEHSRAGDEQRRARDPARAQIEGAICAAASARSTGLAVRVARPVLIA